VFTAPTSANRLGALAWWHPDITDRQFRPLRTDQSEQPGRVTGLADDLEPRPGEQASDAFTQQHIVVGKHHARSAGTPRHHARCP
jgi:hypothetical protein